MAFLNKGCVKILRICNKKVLENFWRKFVFNLMKKRRTDRQTHKENSIPLSLSERVYNTVTNRLVTCNWGTYD